MQDQELRLLKLLNSRQFGQLKSFYNQTTLFNVIGAERSENRHSAFLRWLLSPDSSHGLGYEPLRLFLRLIATLKWGVQTFEPDLYRKILAGGGYDIELIEPAELEKKTDKQNKDRIDIWMVLCFSYEVDGEEKKFAYPVVIENKIYSNEGKDQTKRYFDAMIKYISSVETETGPKYKPIGIFLSPDGKAPGCAQFTSMTYQQLLDYVLDPVSMMQMPVAECSFVETYIRNLGRPSDSANHDFSPLAVSVQERELLSQVYMLDPDLFDAMLVAQYGRDVEKVIGKNILFDDFDQQILLQEVWDANEDVFKAVVYQNYIDKKAILAKLFKGNNRDKTKYRVYYGKDRTEVFPGKRLSKAMAACAIFKAYLENRPQTTLEQLREAFPCKSINSYYWDNYYSDLFYLLPDEYNEYGEPCLKFTAGKHKGEESLAEWDFILSDERLLLLKNGTEKAICVKLWRKGDFDRLLEHVEKQGFSKFIFIDECL